MLAGKEMFVTCSVKPQAVWNMLATVRESPVLSGEV